MANTGIDWGGINRLAQLERNTIRRQVEEREDNLRREQHERDYRRSIDDRRAYQRQVEAIHRNSTYSTQGLSSLYEITGTIMDDKQLKEEKEENKQIRKKLNTDEDINDIDQLI